jgi:hypothetical protein
MQVLSSLLMGLILTIMFGGLAALIVAPLTMPMWVFSAILYSFRPAYRSLWRWCTGVTLFQCLSMIFYGMTWRGLEWIIQPGIALTLLTGIAWFVGDGDTVPIYRRVFGVVLQCCVAGAVVGFTAYKLASS